MTAACNAPLIHRLKRRSREDADPALAKLIEEVESYLPGEPPAGPATQPVVSLRLQTPSARSSCSRSSPPSEPRSTSRPRTSRSRPSCRWTPRAQRGSPSSARPDPPEHAVAVDGGPCLTVAALVVAVTVAACGSSDPTGGVTSTLFVRTAPAARVARRGAGDGEQGALGCSATPLRATSTGLARRAARGTASACGTRRCPTTSRWSAARRRASRATARAVRRRAEPRRPARARPPHLGRTSRGSRRRARARPGRPVREEARSVRLRRRHRRVPHRCRRRVPLRAWPADIARRPAARLRPHRARPVRRHPRLLGARPATASSPRRSGLIPALGPHGFLVITYDEGAPTRLLRRLAGGRIATVVAGPDVRRGAAR